MLPLSYLDSSRSSRASTHTGVGNRSSAATGGSSNRTSIATFIMTNNETRDSAPTMSTFDFEAMGFFPGTADGETMNASSSGYVREEDMRRGESRDGLVGR
jgi:hypothetical protein